ncbi:MAG: MlaD family protein [Alphaproteobacteria bacterium]
METKASYVSVGVFVLALIIAAAAFVIWLAGPQRSDTRKDFRIYFFGTVTGLQTGSGVRFRGIPVGEVVRVRISPDNPELIEVRIKVNDDTPVTVDTHATIEVQGITGNPFIQLKGAKLGSPLLTPRDGRDYAVIQSEPSQIDKLFEDLPKAIASIQQLAQKAELLLNDENRENIGRALKSTANAAEEMERLSKDVGPKISSFFERATPAIDKVDKAANSIELAGNQLAAMVRENRRSLADFTATGLYDFTTFLTEARGLVNALNRLTQKIESDPGHFLFGNPQKGYEGNRR